MAIQKRIEVATNARIVIVSKQSIHKFQQPITIYPFKSL